MTLTLYSVIHSPVELCELRPAGGPTHVVIANRAGFDIDGFQVLITKKTGTPVWVSGFKKIPKPVWA